MVGGGGGGGEVGVIWEDRARRDLGELIQECLIVEF